MLLLDSPLELVGITFFRDHLAADTFHYLPGRPRLVGASGISLLIYRGASAEAAATDAPGQGGLLTLDVDLAHPPAALDALRVALAERFGGTPNLVPVLFDRGAVRLTTLGVTSANGPEDPESHLEPVGSGTAPAPRLVEEVVGAATPSLLGAGRAVFQVALDPEGAVAWQTALRTGTLPAVVAYELGFRGLQPANGTRAEIDYAMAYDYLRTRAALATLWFRADLDREAEELERSGHIRIVDVDYAGSDPTLLAERRAAALATLYELVETIFFRPATSPATLPPSALVGGGSSPSVGASWASAGRPQVAFVLRGVEQDEEQHASYDRAGLGVQTRTVAPQGLITLPPGLDPETVVREVDLVTDDGPRTVTVVAVEGADWSGVDAIRVDLRLADPAGAGSVQSVVLTPTADPAPVLLAVGPADVRVTALTSVPAGDLGAAAGAEPQFQPLTSDTVVVDPAAAAGRGRLTVTLGALPRDLVSAATVEVAIPAEGSAGSTREHTSFVLRPDRPEAGLGVWGATVVDVTAELATVAGPVVVRSRVPIRATAGVAVLNLPRDRFGTVLVSTADPLDRYAGVSIELETAPGRPRARLSLDAANPSAYWSRLREVHEPATYRYRVTRLGRDGVVSAGDWLFAADSLLVVGDRDIDVRPVTVVLAGWAGLAGAVITLTATDPPDGVARGAEALLTADAPRAELRLALRRGSALSYTVTGQIFLDDRVETVLLTAQSTEVLILSPPV